MTAVVWVPLLILGYWWFVEYQPWNPLGGPPIEHKTEYVVTSVVRPGEDVVTTWKYNVYRDDCNRDVELYLVNGRSEQVSAHHGTTQGQGNGLRELTAYVRIPEETPVGGYKLRSVSYWRCNPLRVYTASAEVAFQVKR